MQDTCCNLLYYSVTGKCCETGKSFKEYCLFLRCYQIAGLFGYEVKPEHVLR